MPSTIRRRALLVTTGLGLMAAFSGTGAAAANAKKGQAAPGWELKGSRIIACCCGSPCPCRINQPPTQRHGCDYTTAVRIDRGRLGKIRMDGVTFAIVGVSFAEDTKANRVYVYASDKATSEQMQALQEFLGAGGEALGAKAPYIAGKAEGLRQVPMTYTISADRRDHNFRIPDILELKTRSIILPGRTKPVTSEGIFDDFGDRFVHAECLTHTYDDKQIKHSWDLTGRQANQADFTLSGERVAKGGIGWSCWSAHADLGSKGKYQEELIGHPRE